MAKVFTIREIARLVGCSPTTVSLALRNHPRISPATRDRIIAIAERTGYARDPVVSTLMTQLRSARKARPVEKLAILTWWDKPGSRHNARGIALHDGIHARARQLGYEIEEFWAREPRMTMARLSHILHSRSIRGVIFMSMMHARGRVSLTWPHFATAAVGQTIIKPGLHHATQAFFHGMMLTLRNLKRHGYTRVGYTNLIEQDDMNSNVWLSAYLGYQHRTTQREIIPALLVPAWEKGRLLEWIERYKIQVIVTNMHEQILALLHDAGLRVPEDISLASLDCIAPVDTCAGIDILRGEIGAKTVDLVVEQLQNNELGLPAHPKIVSIEGVWRDGSSLRKPLP